MSGGGLRVGSLFITGANRGIGLEFVKQLTQLPQPPKHIFATCRNPDAAQVGCRCLVELCTGRAGPVCVGP